MTGVGGRSDTKTRLILKRISMKNKDIGVCGRSRGQAQSWHVDLCREWKLQGRLVILFLHLTLFVRSWPVCFRREWRLEGRLVTLIKHLTICAQSWHLCLRREWRLEGRLVIPFLHLTIVAQSWRREWRSEGFCAELKCLFPPRMTVGASAGEPVSRDSTKYCRGILLDFFFLCCFVRF